MNTTTRSLSALLISLCGACVQDVGGAAEPPDTERARSAPSALTVGIDDSTSIVGPNGVTLNGLKINGLKINGLKINGLKINGLKINGTTLSGVALGSFAIVNGTALSGTTELGTAVGWQDFIGASMVAVTESGAEVNMRIDAITPREDPELLDYVISYKPTKGPWAPACGTTEDGQPIPAIPLTGAWNYQEGVPGGGSYIANPSPPMFTFACNMSVLEKCASAGYKPWGFAVETKGNQSKVRSLRPLHQACTRMMRADYCGDGMPHTVENTRIDIWDALGIEVETQGWDLEAEWTVNGASCVGHVRYTSQGDEGVEDTLSYIASHCPAVLPSSSCGSQSSTFNVNTGWSTPLTERSLFRNSSCAPPAFPNCDIDGVPEE
jgi:hypothetical protein